MKAVHKWATYHSNQSECLPEVHLPINLSAVDFRICPFPPLLRTKILMRVHVFGWRARVLLTLYLKREQNLTHDAVLLMWHFLCMGIFTHQASAVRRRLRLLCGCYSEAVLPSNLSWAPLIYCCLIGYRTFSPTLIYVLTEQEPQYSQQLCKALGYFFFLTTDLLFLLPDSLIII